MRASDADRDRVAEILREAHGEGRLRQDELLERVEATYSAQTFRDLDRVIEDLPIPRRPPGVLARTPRSALPETRPGVGRRLVRGFLTFQWWVYLSVVLLCVMIWALTDPQNFWPGWVAGPWGVVLGVGELAYRTRRPRA